MKVLEKKTNLEGTAVIVDNNGVKSYEISIPGKDTKVIAESTFKRNYKKIEEEVAVTEEATDGGSEMENLNETVEVVEEVELSGNEEEVVIIDDATEEEITEIETSIPSIVYSEHEQLKIEVVSTDIINVAKALLTDRLEIIKESKSIKVNFELRDMQLKIDCEVKLFDGIVANLNGKAEELELKIKSNNTFKRPNPAAFKAKGVLVEKDGRELTFGTRKQAVNWIEKLHADGEIESKPTYYQIKKAIENNGQYLGYTWKEIDASEVKVEA